MGSKKVLDKALINNFLPEGLLLHFDITEVLELGDVPSKTIFFEIYLEERNEILGSYDSSAYESKGFTEITVQDFPIRGRAVYLKIKRRRWRHKKRSNEIIRNDFSYVAEGSGFTQELSDFLKETGRYKGGYDNQHR